jgi:hypothetical protein
LENWLDQGHVLVRFTARVELLVCCRHPTHIYWQPHARSQAIQTQASSLSRTPSCVQGWSTGPSRLKHHQKSRDDHDSTMPEPASASARLSRSCYNIEEGLPKPCGCSLGGTSASTGRAPAKSGTISITFPLRLALCSISGSIGDRHHRVLNRPDGFRITIPAARDCASRVPGSIRGFQMLSTMIGYSSDR